MGKSLICYHPLNTKDPEEKKAPKFKQLTGQDKSFQQSWRSSKYATRQIVNTCTRESVYDNFFSKNYGLKNTITKRNIFMTCDRGKPMIHEQVLFGIGVY